MLKMMCINITINTEIDTNNEVEDLITAVIEECNDRFVSIDSVTMDEIEIFNVHKGFID